VPTVTKFHTCTVQKIGSPHRNLFLKEDPGKKVLSEQPETDAFVTTGIGSRSELQTSV